MLSVYILLWLSIDIHRYKQKKRDRHTQPAVVRACADARFPTFPTVFCNEFLPCSSSVSCQCISIVTGWWLTYPSEKYESQLGLLFPIYGKIKNVPNISKPPTKYQLSMWTSNGIYMDTARVFNPGLGPGVKASSMARLELQAHTATSHGIWTLNKWLKCLTHDLLSYPSFTNIPATCPVSTSNPCEGKLVTAPKSCHIGFYQETETNKCRIVYTHIELSVRTWASDASVWCQNKILGPHEGDGGFGVPSLDGLILSPSWYEVPRYRNL